MSTAKFSNMVLIILASNEREREREVRWQGMKSNNYVLFPPLIPRTSFMSATDLHTRLGKSEAKNFVWTHLHITNIKWTHELKLQNFASLLLINSLRQSVRKMLLPWFTLAYWMATCSLDVLLQQIAKQYYRTQQHARANEQYYRTQQHARANGCGCVAHNHETDVKIICRFTYNKKKICLKNRKYFVTRNSSFLTRTLK
jgi:hypothetical protein